MKTKNHGITSIDVEKAFEKIQYTFIIKTFNKVNIEETYFNIIKIIYDKPIANIILSGEELKASKKVLWFKKKDKVDHSPLSTNIVLQVLAIAIRQEKEMRNPN